MRCLFTLLPPTEYLVTAYVDSCSWGTEDLYQLRVFAWDREEAIRHMEDAIWNDHFDLPPDEIRRILASRKFDDEQTAAEMDEVCFIREVVCTPFANLRTEHLPLGSRAALGAATFAQRREESL